MVSPKMYVCVREKEKKLAKGLNHIEPEAYGFEHSEREKEGGGKVERKEKEDNRRQVVSGVVYH